MTKQLSAHDNEVLNMMFDISKVDSVKDANKPVIDELPAEIKGESWIF